jgi:hypothetical protein
MFLFYIYFHFFPLMFQHLCAILNGVHSNYIKLYRALTCDSTGRHEQHIIPEHIYPIPGSAYNAHTTLNK